MSESHSENQMSFKVLEVDGETALLLDWGLALAAKAHGISAIASGNQLVEFAAHALAGVEGVGTGFWCRPDAELEEGAVISGKPEFNPKEALQRGRLPKFFVAA